MSEEAVGVLGELPKLLDQIFVHRHSFSLSKSQVEGFASTGPAGAKSCTL
jgi:hypothetical protein